MRNRNRRLAVVPACVAAIVPSVLLMTARKDHPLSDGMAGLIVGVLIGVSVMTVVVIAKGCGRTPTSQG